MNHNGMFSPRMMTDVDHVDGCGAPTTKSHVMMPSAKVRSTSKVHLSGCVGVGVGVGVGGVAGASERVWA